MKKRVLVTIVGLVTLLLLLLFVRMTDSITVDKQCIIAHNTTTTPPSKFETAQDFFEITLAFQ